MKRSRHHAGDRFIHMRRIPHRWRNNPMPTYHQLIMQLVNASLKANKWAMWIEMHLPKQATYVPAIYQVRDAYFHLIRLYAGFSEGLSTDDMPQTLHDYMLTADASAQLREAMRHIARGFFDTADYIILHLRLEKRSKKAYREYLTLNQKLASLSQDILHLRDNRSDLVENHYANIEKWDGILEALTTAFVFCERTIALKDLSEGILHDMFLIEAQYPQESITQWYPDFYARKSEIHSLVVSSPVGFTQYIEALAADSRSALSPAQWIQENNARLDEQKRDLEKFRTDLHNLVAMFNSTTIASQHQSTQKRVSDIIFNLFTGGVGATFTWVINNLLMQEWVQSESGEMPAVTVLMHVCILLMLWVLSMLAFKQIFLFAHRRYSLFRYNRTMRKGERPPNDRDHPG